MSCWKNIKPGPGKVHKFPPFSSLYKLTDAKDSKAGLTLIAIGDAEFKGACKALNAESILEEKPEWKTLMGRMKDMGDVMQFFADKCASFDRDELIKLAEENGVPCAPALSINETMAHPQARFCEIFQTCSHPQLGIYTLPRHGSRFSVTPASSAGAPAPLLGEHSESVLLSVGLPPGEVASLISSGALRAARPVEQLLVPSARSAEVLWGKARVRASAVNAFRSGSKQRSMFNRTTSKVLDEDVQKLIKRTSSAMLTGI